MSDRAELLEATLDSLPEGAALLGENCQVVFWNQAAQAITGYAAQDATASVGVLRLSWSLRGLYLPRSGTRVSGSYAAQTGTRRLRDGEDSDAAR